LEYTASLMLKGSRKLATERVNAMLRDMGLESCQDTRVGNELVKGLSGGQRRRLSLAVALLGQPLVIFLDEITSGLDAASAAGIMSFLSDMTKMQQVVTICTIHQPSAKVFKSIDKLVLLSAGRVAYCGQTSAAVPYFKSLGRIMPDQENPADFVLEQINKDFVDPDKVEALLDAWQGGARPFCREVSTQSLADVPALKTNGRQSVCREVSLLLKRQVTLAFRDPMVYSGRMLMSLLTCTLFSLIYIESRDREQSQILSRQWLLAWHIGIPLLMSMVYCFAAGDEFRAVSKEVRSNNYRLGSYLLAQFIVQWPLLALIALCSTVPSGFGIAGWTWGAFFEIEAMLLGMLWIYESLAQLLAVAAPHPAMATMGVTAFWLVNFLFGGSIVRRDDVPWPFKLLSYAAPYGYASRSAVRSEFIDSTFAGAVRTADGSYSCPHATLLTGCFGITGEEVLSSLSQIIYNMTPENYFWQDLGLLFGIALLFKVLFVATAYASVSRAITIGAPPAQEESKV